MEELRVSARSACATRSSRTSTNCRATSSAASNKFLNANGRSLIGWDEILEGGLAPNATVQAWRGMDAAATAARAGHDVIVSPTSHCYLDYPQFTPNGDVASAFAIDGCSHSTRCQRGSMRSHQRHILGLRRQHLDRARSAAPVSTVASFRAFALSEIAWSPAEQHDWTEFRGRLRTHLKRLDALGVKLLHRSAAICLRRRGLHREHRRQIGKPGLGWANCLHARRIRAQ